MLFYKASHSFENFLDNCHIMECLHFLDICFYKTIVLITSTSNVFTISRTILFFSGRDPVVIERSNLVNISKLIVKELIEQSLRYGRMLDSDHMPLQHFFIVLEHVLRHGLKPKKVRKSVCTNSRRFIWCFLLGFTRTKERIVGYITNGRKVCT